MATHTPFGPGAARFNVTLQYFFPCPFFTILEQIFLFLFIYFCCILSFFLPFEAQLYALRHSINSFSRAGRRLSAGANQRQRVARTRPGQPPAPAPGPSTRLTLAPPGCLHAIEDAVRLGDVAELQHTKRGEVFNICLFLSFLRAQHCPVGQLDDASSGQVMSFTRTESPHHHSYSRLGLSFFLFSYFLPLNSATRLLSCLNTLPLLYLITALGGIIMRIHG
jgi:hypothetical protein